MVYAPFSIDSMSVFLTSSPWKNWAYFMLLEGCHLARKWGLPTVLIWIKNNNNNKRKQPFPPWQHFLWYQSKHRPGPFTPTESERVFLEALGKEPKAANDWVISLKIFYLTWKSMTLSLCRIPKYNYILCLCIMWLCGCDFFSPLDILIKI